jgi:hypothetical protein
VSGYWLQIGTTMGGTNIYSADQGTNLSRTVNGLPVNGSTLYVRLWSRIGDGWLYNDYTYTGAFGPAQVRFFNNLVICNPNCNVGFTARLTASEGYTWFSTSG